MDGNNVPQSRFIELLLHAENRILRHLEDAKLNHGFRGNLDLLLRLWIDPGASFPLLFYELPKSRHDEFAVLSCLYGATSNATGPHFTRMPSTFGRGDES
jgi:hypothetical protein